MPNKPTYEELEQRVKEFEQTEKALKERIKELGCISDLVKLVENSNTLEEIFTKFPVIIQPAMQHIDNVHSNLIVDGKTFYCVHGKLEIKPEWSYASDIIVNDIKRGDLIVFYDKDFAFLEEEKELCHILTERLGKVIERAEIKQALKESEEKFRNLADLLPLIVFELNLEGRFTYLNYVTAKLTGYPFEELVGLEFKDIYSEEDCARAYTAMQKTLSEGGIGINDYDFIRPDGSTMPVQVHSNVIFKDGKPVGLRGIALDLTEPNKAQKALNASLKEKEILLQEIQHRTKNNMAVISGLLELQVKNVTDKKAKEALQDSQSRVQTMSMIHETLYRSDSLSSIDMQTYFTDLGRIIIQSYNVSGKAILKVKAEHIFIGVKQASPLGLIVNELITNSLKYAFPDDKKGEVKISLWKSEDQIKLEYSDDGIGLPQDFDIQKNSDSLGLKLIKMLAEDQLGGSIDMESNNGTKFIIKFKLDT
jgi:PAS domain S-box-containing protein